MFLKCVEKSTTMFPIGAGHLIEIIKWNSTDFTIGRTREDNVMSFNMSRLLSYFAALISRIVSGLFNAFLYLRWLFTSLYAFLSYIIYATTFSKPFKI